METLIVSSKVPFSSLVKVGEGMSYNQTVFKVSARGKQIQRAFEIISILHDKERVGEIVHDYGSIDIEGKRVPTMDWTVTPPSTHKGDDE